MEDSLLFQLRSQTVNDYKELLDVTVGGHLLSTETVEDGIREIDIHSHFFI
ncbi:hypothetical protein [Macrococcus hajekii]|nr:hypothetical protein [Macrococcus hajekii]